jgi:hypothetical protein
VERDRVAAIAGAGRPDGSSTAAAISDPKLRLLSFALREILLSTKKTARAAEAGGSLHLRGPSG